MNKHIGIYGGSFNPIHKAHIRLAKALLKEAGLDEVWLMVSPQNPLKSQADLLDDHKRLQLARLALQHERRLVACDYEFRLPRPSYTFDTMQALAADYPDHHFTLLIGGDNWQRFPQWYRHDDLLRRYPIVIYPRADAPIDESTLPAGVRLVHTPLINISSTSSTDIRRRIREGRSIARLVPPAVAEMIQKEGLYKDVPAKA